MSSGIGEAQEIYLQIHSKDADQNTYWSLTVMGIGSLEALGTGQPQRLSCTKCDRFFASKAAHQVRDLIQ